MPHHSRLLLVWAFLCFGAHPSTIAGAAPSEPASPPSHELIGVWAGEGPHGLLVISPRKIPGGSQALVLTDLGTGAVRALFPGPDGELRAGATLVRPEPVAHRLRLLPPAADGAHRLEIEDVDTGVSWLARRLPLRQEEVRLERDGVELHGTLHLPSTQSPYPGVVLAPGSEEQDRHSMDAMPYLLAHLGFATVAFDKRGSGSSGGSWDVSHDVLAADLVAWVDRLASRADVGETIGVLGFSEGAWLAPLAASRTPLVDFIVAIGGGALPKAESFVYQRRRRLVEQGLGGDDLRDAMVEHETLIREALARARSGADARPFDLRMAHDPAEEWSSFRGPILYVLGGADTLEPVQPSVERMEEVLAAARHPDYTIRVFPRAHHSLFLAETGEPSEFDRMEGIAWFVPGYWETLVRWLERRARGG